MSGNDYHAPFHPNNTDEMNQTQGNAQGPSWTNTNWLTDPRYNMQNYSRHMPHNSAPYLHRGNIRNHYNPLTRGRNQRYFRGFPRNRGRSPGHQFMGNSGYEWQRNQDYKRTREDIDNGEHIHVPQEIVDVEQHSKSSKKRKKSLSQNIPLKKDWTTEEAECALGTEKAYNKKTKNALIIKFPDQELNKDIVSQFHPAIENVHFQQPCTPRFCFVTLQESANAEEIINALNKQKFADGYLTVEFKKDREEDQVILPDDIDPLTLYVGNLAQEVTKDDIVNLFPNHKRIDIGYAKKMKYTRYAFIGFRTAAECLEAFKLTHCKQMYSKSLIVRFRRLHGTMGMPGEAKPQNSPKGKRANEITDLKSSASTCDQAESTVSNSTSINDNSDNLEEDVLITSPELNVGRTQQPQITFDSNGDRLCPSLTTMFDLDHIGGSRLNHSGLRQEEPKKRLRGINEIQDLFVESITRANMRNPFATLYDDIERSPSPYCDRQTTIKTEPDVVIKTECNDKFCMPKIKLEPSFTGFGIKSEPLDTDEELFNRFDRFGHNDEGLRNVSVDGGVRNRAEDDEDDVTKIYESILRHRQKLKGVMKGRDPLDL